MLSKHSVKYFHSLILAMIVNLFYNLASVQDIFSSRKMAFTGIVSKFVSRENIFEKDEKNWFIIRYAQLLG